MLFSMKSGEVSSVQAEEGNFAIYMVQEHKMPRSDSYSSVEEEVKASLAKSDVEMSEINNWYHHAIGKRQGVKRYYDLPSE